MFVKLKQLLNEAYIKGSMDEHEDLTLWKREHSLVKILAKNEVTSGIMDRRTGFPHFLERQP
jgi:hypothetical protein